jgi:hypothetical protein
VATDIGFAIDMIMGRVGRSASRQPPRHALR